MGGRVAEELIFNEGSTGASNDIKRATELAHRMVCEWGMSEKLGPMTFGKREEHIFLGREISRSKDYSEQTAIIIDQEVRIIIDSCYERATNLLKTNIDKLNALAEALLERETLDKDDVDAIMRGEKLAPLSKPVSPPAEPVPVEGKPSPTPDGIKKGPQVQPA